MYSPVAVKLALALVIAIVAGSARAQDIEEMAAFRTQCGLGYVRLCADTDPNGPGVRACFRQNRAKLSGGCAAAIGAYEVRQASIPAAR